MGQLPRHRVEEEGRGSPQRYRAEEEGRGRWQRLDGRYQSAKDQW